MTTSRLIIGDCLDVMPTLPADSVHAIVCDPPYGLEFMGKEWDRFLPEKARHREWDGRRRGDTAAKWESSVHNRGDGRPGGPCHSVASHYKPNRKCRTCGRWQFDKNPCRCDSPDLEYRCREEAPGQRLGYQGWCTAWAVEALRVAKPGAFLLAFGGTRTFHRLTCAIEDAGWEIRDCIMYLYGSGFPKSLDVSKAIDKAAGAEREVVGISATKNQKQQPSTRAMRPRQLHPEYGDTVPVTAPTTDAAKQWDGWGTALKPAWEPVIVARKPLDGTVANNVLKHGCGGLNVDACRVGSDGGTQAINFGDTVGIMYGGGKGKPKNEIAELNKGRWPANVVHDGSDEVVGEFPETGASNIRPPTGQDDRGVPGFVMRRVDSAARGHSDNGGSAARFFYCAKSSRQERNAGLDSIRTVKYDVPQLGDVSCKDASTVLVELLRRATSGSTATWLTDESGASIMGLCLSASLSTTLTAIGRITESKILSLLTPSLISESTAGVSYGPVSGGSLAENAANSSRSRQITTSANQAALVHGVKAAVSPMLSQISDGENWKPFRNFHATVKPLALMEWLVKLVTPPGGTTLDPFMGSGTTGIACGLLGHDFIGIEKDPQYVEIAQARVREHCGLLVELAGQ